MAVLDKKDCIILNTLQENCRTSLTDLAKKVGLSVDSVKKRIAKMLNAGVFHSKIQIRPRRIGFHYIVDIKVKLHNYSEKDLQTFIKHLNDHPRVAELFSISGMWDFTIVIIAKDHEDFAIVKGEIKEKFSNIIAEWIESSTSFVYKFEKYDLLKLMGVKE